MNLKIAVSRLDEYRSVCVFELTNVAYIKYVWSKSSCDISLVCSGTSKGLSWIPPAQLTDSIPEYPACHPLEILL